MNKKNKKMVMIALVVLVFLGAMSFLKNKNNGLKNNKTMLTQEQMKEDLDEIVSKVKELHPEISGDFTKEQKEVIDKAYEEIKEPMKGEDFTFVLSRLTSVFQDSNTYVSMFLSQESKSIELYGIWLKDGLYVKETIGDLQKGDKIVSIGGKTTDEVLEMLLKTTSSDNSNWVKTNYINNIILESYLREFGLIDNDSVKVEVERNGEKKKISLPIGKLVDSEAYRIINKNNKAAYEDQKITYTIDEKNKLGVLKINQFGEDGKFKKTLKEFFREVKDKSIENIAIDIKENIGGSDKGLNELMRYFHIDKYKYFTKYTKKEKDEERKDNVIENKKVKDELLFKGNIYVLTSMKTFATGNFFATIVADNKLGTIVGEPTASRPSPYANTTKLYKLPKSNYGYSVSDAKFIRPSAVEGEETSLTPDYEIYTTINDVISGINPQLERVIELINKGV